jgi:HAD superfamily hydrolase (TIGR01549 family)
MNVRIADGNVAPTDLRAILFDLDGTLLDSFQSHLETYRATLAGFGVALDARQFGRHYSPNWNEFYRRVGLAPRHWDAASAAWLREAAGHQPRLFPGVAAMLRRLQRHFHLGVVTAGSRSRVHADLERGGIHGLFEVVVTADDVREPKPAPEGLQLALRTLGSAPHQALYVGDTGPDYTFARAAGVPFVAVVSAFAPPGRRAGHPRLAAITDLPGYLGVGG